MGVNQRRDTNLSGDSGFNSSLSVELSGQGAACTAGGLITGDSAKQKLTHLEAIRTSVKQSIKPPVTCPSSHISSEITLLAPTSSSRFLKSISLCVLSGTNSPTESQIKYGRYEDGAQELRSLKVINPREPRERGERRKERKEINKGCA